ncbi:MAG: GDP-mannose 4,6-dehydratase [bacterium]
MREFGDVNGLKKIFITGINGFAGSHLAEHLLAETDAQIHGLVKPGSPRKNIAGFQDKLQLHEGNLLDEGKIINILSEIQPDQIYHLAAVANPEEAGRSPRKTYQVNVIGQLNLLESVVELNLSPEILIVGSSSEYGFPPPELLPLDESAPLAPANTYGTTKVSQEMMGRQYYEGNNLKIMSVRSFNHTGPRRPSEYVCSSFVRQAVLIEAGRKSPVIETGDLQKIRDFSDVRDVVRAYHLALEKGQPGEIYNICSGEPRQIIDVLELILELAGLKRDKIQIKSSRGEITSSDEVYGTAQKIMDRTGWSPKIPFRRTMQDLLSYWRNNLKK